MNSYESHESKRYDDQGERFVPKRATIDADKWTQGYTFTMFPRYESLQGILGISQKGIYDALTGDHPGMYFLAMMRLADIGMKLSKDELRLKRGLDRYHFKSDEETVEMQALFNLPRELGKIATGEEND